MRSYKISIAVLGLLLGGSAGRLAAQDALVSFRSNGAVPLEKVADAGMQPGFGFGTTVAIRPVRYVDVYGGWDWLHFTADRSFAGRNVDFEETGYSFGLAFERPFLLGARTSYRFEGGGPTNTSSSTTPAT